MNRLARLAALALPLLGLAVLWAQSDSHYRKGTEWEVPVAGYDPRDLLRGHYVEFAYDWPLAGGPVESGLTLLCLEGTPPRIAQARPVEKAALAACPHPLRVAPGDIYGKAGLERGRLYVGQDRARALEERLADRDQRGIVTIRQRANGSFTAVAIRFRPLTPAERAARDEADENGRRDLRAPPAIMSR